MPTVSPMPKKQPEPISYVHLEIEGTDYVSASEAAALVGVHRDTMRRWADRKLIPCVRTPTGHRRFLVADLDATMRRQA